MYDDGQPGEIFLVMAKEGSAISGLMDSFATAISLALQYGVPIKVLIDKFSHVRFEPSGHTGNAEVPYAKSIVDYIFRWLASKFLPREEQVQTGVHVADEPQAASLSAPRPAPSVALSDYQSMHWMMLPPVQGAGASWCATGPAISA
jgi:ribonucleoside-diphosphate reductase alpha chain